MKIARIATADGARWVVERDGGWAEVVDGLDPAPALTGEVHAFDEVTLLAACDPRVVVGIAQNKGNDHPLPIQAWLKSPRSVVGPAAPIQARREVGTVNVEGELAAVIRRNTDGLVAENAFDYVVGWTIANDVTNVDRNTIDEKIFEGKGGHGYTALGPWIVTELPDPENVAITVHVNDRLRCDSGTFNLGSTVAESIAYVAQWVPLGPGDVIMTGAPATFTAVAPGDRVSITLSGIGTLTNPVA